MIRPAAPGDVGEIAALVRALAAYERLAHECVVSEDALREHMFGPRRYAEALVAVDGAEVAGFALFFHTYSTFLGRPGLWLEDLFVRPERRGRGHGGALLRAVARAAVERGCGRLEWSVLDWNEDALGFYSSLGAGPVDGWTTYRLSGDALRTLGADPLPLSLRGS